MKAEHLIKLIEGAFADVVLGNGLSLRQAELVDDMSYAKDERWDSVRQSDILDNWQRISVRDLEDHPYLAHMDAEGFRYYIPALIRLFIQNYDAGSLHCIQTVSSLSPTQKVWQYRMNQFALLNQRQKAAIAEFLTSVPKLIELHPEDAKMINEALSTYWNQFLPNKM